MTREGLQLVTMAYLGPSTDLYLDTYNNSVIHLYNSGSLVIKAVEKYIIYYIYLYIKVY